MGTWHDLVLLYQDDPPTSIALGLIALAAIAAIVFWGVQLVGACRQSDLFEDDLSMPADWDPRQRPLVISVKPKAVVICGWCPDSAARTHELTAQGVVVSHGMCISCQKEQMAEAKRIHAIVRDPLSSLSKPASKGFGKRAASR